MAELPPDGSLNHGVGFRIYRTGSFVKHQYFTVLDKGATESHELPFASPR